ncbi:AzlC family ABC transporter permease [Pseudonocardia sp. WMMC193]|uniref:AzlC family ABC transporter permease n=1 Tax=Pseudonocardia sp. WMMC193 TaxID=2911965 RepID=UPI001F48ED80|nr:AzlC family ABC transporter permease [Pseudonocardia sp. WMMC193]MCF7549248.1 AzlC family ABC transporter permease [Pseudonocardia sp. WMMC193]
MRSAERTVDLRDVAALAAAVGIVGMSYGALAASAGVPWPLVVGMSLLVFAGGSQFLAVAVVVAGGAPAAAVAAGLLINLRHLPFGFAIGEVVGRSWPARLVGAHLLIDENVALTRSRGTGPRGTRVYWLCGASLFVAWNLGSVVGLLAGGRIPDPAVFGVDAAFPAALLALLLPSLRQADARRVGIAAAVLALAATPFLPAGVPVLVGLAGLLVALRPAQEVRS